MLDLWHQFRGHLDWIVAGLCFIIAIFSLGPLILVSLFWRRIEPYYSETWLQTLLALLRAAAAIMALWAKASEDPNRHWWSYSIGAAIIAYCVVELTGAIGNGKLKSSKAELEAGLADAQRDHQVAKNELLRISRLLTHLHGLANEKKQRIRTTLQANSNPRNSIGQVRNGLKPTEQVHVLLECLASTFLLDAVFDGLEPQSPNFRVGLFVERDGVLEPLDAFDLASKKHDPFSSHREHRDRYELNNDANPSHAVVSVRSGRLLIVEDCEKEESFTYFHEKQRNYLRSLVTYPLSGFCEDGVNQVRAVLLVDTNIPGFFLERDRTIIERRLKEFGTRIELEYCIQALLRPNR